MANPTGTQEPNTTEEAPERPLAPPQLSDYEVPTKPPEPQAAPTPANRKLVQKLDPRERARVAELAKWGLLLGIGGFFVWLKALLWSVAYMAIATAPPDTVPLSKIFYDLVPVGAILAAFVASGVIRFIRLQTAKNRRAMTYRAVDAVRDWGVIGIVTGVLSVLVVLLVRVALPQIPTGERTLAYYGSRLLAFGIAATVGVFVARKVAIRREMVMASGKAGIVYLVGQVVLVALLTLPFNDAVDRIVRAWTGLTWAAGGPALIGMIWGFATLNWAWRADQKLRVLQGGKQGKTRRYVPTGSDPIEINLTVLGGRESGKTVLLAGAYREWQLQTAARYGLVVKPVGSMPINYEQLAPDAKQYYQERNLDYLADSIYNQNQWPPSTQGMREFKFDVFVQVRDGVPPRKVARINLLDYPGSLLVTSDLSATAHQKFWQRVADSDGILFVGDMSALRRGVTEEGQDDLHTAFRAVMELLIDGRTEQRVGVPIEARLEGNGKHRVIPVGLALTKCDECLDLVTGQPNHIWLDNLIYGQPRVRDPKETGTAVLRYSGPYGLLQEWEAKCQKDGPGFAEAEIFKTTAITRSRPAVGPDGQYDLTRRFEMISPRDTHPTNCATPLLWLTAKVLRWNLTTYTELHRWLMGSAAPEVQEQQDAIRRIEQVVELWQNAVEERRNRA